MHAPLPPPAALPPRNLALIGPMGAGKSSIGQRLAGALGLQFVDADRALEAHLGCRIADIFDYEGEAGFRRRESALLAQLMQHSGQLLATGGGVVLEADNRARLRQNSLVVYLAVDVAEQSRRLAHDTRRPLLQTADREATLRQLARQRAPLYAQTAHLCFDTSGHDRESACQTLLERLLPYWSLHP